MTEEKDIKMLTEVHHVLDNEITYIGQDNLEKVKNIKLLDYDITSINEKNTKEINIFKIFSVQPSLKAWTGKIRFQLKSSKPYDDRIIKEYHCQYAIKAHLQKWIEIKSTLLQLINSKFTSEFYVPHGLTAVSMLIIIRKLSTLVI